MSTAFDPESWHITSLVKAIPALLIYALAASACSHDGDNAPTTTTSAVPTTLVQTRTERPGPTSSLPASPRMSAQPRTLTCEQAAGRPTSPLGEVTAEIRQVGSDIAVDWRWEDGRIPTTGELELVATLTNPTGDIINELGVQWVDGQVENHYINDFNRRVDVKTQFKITPDTLEVPFPDVAALYADGFTASGTISHDGVVVKRCSALPTSSTTTP